MNSSKTKLFLIVVFCVTLQACASSARPYKYNGGYYMVGDSSCSQFNVRTSNSINCYDSKGTPTGYRNAMTDQDMMMYTSQQSASQSSAPSFNNTVNCTKIGDISGQVYQFKGFCPAGYF